MRPPARRLALLMTLAASMNFGQVSAAPMLAPGARIRVSVARPESQRWVGSFVAAVDDTLTLRTEQAGDSATALVAIPVHEVTRLELSDGHHRHVLRNAGLGLALGACMGGVIAASVSNGTNSEFGVGFNIVAGAGAVGVIGTALGALHGFGHSSERWRPLPLSELRSAVLN